jgi:hypothetical protein
LLLPAKVCGVETALEQIEAAVALLAALDLTTLPLEQLQALAIGSEKAAGRLRGIANRSLGAVEEQAPDSTPWWWRDALGLSGEAAAHAVRRARALRSLPLLTDAVVDGTVSLEKAGAFTPLVGKLPELEIHQEQQSYLAGAAVRTVDGVQQWVRTIIAMNSERDLELEQATAVQREYFKGRVTSDGMYRGSFALALENAEATQTVMEALSRKTGVEDTRTAGRRRADAFMDVFGGAATWMDLPQTGGQRAHVSYVVDAAWARGAAGATPPVGAWTGPQTRSYLDMILCDARISRVLLDGTGQVIRLESLNDEISPGQRKALVGRDRHCVAHGCTRPPAFCDVHHLTARADGGPTELGNLALLCRRHHRMWHKGHLRLHQLRLPWLHDPPQAA